MIVGNNIAAHSRFHWDWDWGGSVDGQEQATQFVTVFVGEKVREYRSTRVSPDYICLAEFTFENPGIPRGCGHETFERSRAAGRGVSSGGN